MRKTSAAMLLCFVVFMQPAWTQDVSKKKEIAVFNLSYTNWQIPNSILGSIDEEIRSVFINLGRFNVIGMTYRLGESDVNQFIDKIKEFKSENAVIPDQVQMGQEFFTQADMNKLIGSFIVVIPSVADYRVETLDSGDYSVTLKTSLTFVNVETIQTIGQFFVETSSVAKKLDDATRSVVNQIPAKLTFEIRKIPEFQIKSGILEVHGPEVIFELGKDMGIKVGDEYEVIGTRVLPSGKQVTEENGLLLVRKVDEEVSYATTLFSSGALQMGDQIREIARVGTESALYARMVVWPQNGGLFPPFIVGVRQTLSRGLYGFKPFVELESPLHLLNAATFPFNVALGGEYNFYIGRLQFAPQASLGFGIDTDFSSTTYISRLGFNAGLEASLLVSRDVKIRIEAGYLYWWSLSTLYSAGYSGVFAGAGIVLKY